MGIALTLQEYLDDHHIAYDVMLHKRTHCSQDTARASHVPGERLAKAVVLTREGGFVVAVVPACSAGAPRVIERMLHCPVSMASEDEIGELFPDCDMGAVPPVRRPTRSKPSSTRASTSSPTSIWRAATTAASSTSRASSSARSCRTCGTRPSPPHD